MNSPNKSPVPLIQGMNTQEVALVFIITVWSDLPTKVLAASINSDQLNLTEDKGWGKLYKVLFILSPQILFTSYIHLDAASWSGHTNTISHCTSSCIRVARPRDKGRVGTGTMCLRMVAGVANVPFMVTTSDTETDSAVTLYHCQVVMVLAYLMVFCILPFSLCNWTDVTGQMTGNFYND